MNGFRSGQKVRRIVHATSSAWWRRIKKPAALNGLPCRFGGRGKMFAQKVEGSQHVRCAPLDPPVLRRAVSSDYKWGVRVREWVAGLAERAILLVVGSCILLKDGGVFVRDLWLSGQELLARRLSPDLISFETFEKEVLEGRLQSGCQRLKKQPNQERVGDDPLPTVGSTLHSFGLREEVERAKISFLDSEEEDLAEDILEDQAGALRSRLASVASEEDNNER